MSKFQCNHIIVIQSLEIHESQTGQYIAEFIAQRIEKYSEDIDIEIINCEGAPDFRRIMQNMEEYGKQGMRPIIHIECHGDAKTGLEFSNGSDMSWNELTNLFSRLNIATKFNTIAIVSACFGAYFLTRTSPILPAPFFALISPTDTIVPYEIKRSLEGFYEKFITEKSMDSALGWLDEQRLGNGVWFYMVADKWFQKTFDQYIDNNCSRRASIERAKAINLSLKEGGAPQLSQNKIFNLLRDRHQNFDKEAFYKFFSIEQVPENLDRFKDILLMARNKIQQVRASGQHIL